MSEQPTYRTVYMGGPDPESGRHRIQVCHIEWSIAGDEVELWATGPFGKVGAAGADVFRALFGVRRQLDEKGWQVLCAGARREAWHSMPEYPCGIDQARLYPRFGAGAEDVVDVLATDDNVTLLASPVEQLMYRDEWAGTTPPGRTTWSEFDRRRRERLEARGASDS